MEKTKKYYKVLKRYSDEVSGERLVKIECECGNIVIKPSAFTSWSSKTCGNRCPLSKQLKSNASRSHVREMAPQGFTGMSRVYDLYKRRALKKGFEFSLSKEEFRELTSSPCFYCKEPPSMEYVHRIKRASKREIENSRYFYNSLDRIDSSRGYTLDNVRPSCKCCNTMKWDHPEDFFKERVKIFYEFYFKNEIKAGGVEVRGLTNRRLAENKVCLGKDQQVNEALKALERIKTPLETHEKEKEGVSEAVPIKDVIEPLKPNEQHGVAEGCKIKFLGICFKRS